MAAAMPTKNPGSVAASVSPDSTAAVDAFMLQLDHPFKPEVELLRCIVLAVDPGIAEGIKWNAPSFRTTEYFATTHLRGKGAVGLILHLGAKARELPAGGLAIADPAGLLRWLGKDRAMLEFRCRAEIEAARTALTAIVREWIRHV
jgi:hypothetical protein